MNLVLKGMLGEEQNEKTMFLNRFFLPKKRIKSVFIGFECLLPVERKIEILWAPKFLQALKVIGPGHFATSFSPLNYPAAIE